MAQTQLIAGRFQQGKEIGVGGMGTVYLGMDTQTGEQVAIKVLKPDIVRDAPDLLERFEREGDALRRLNHPTIVKVLGTVEENGNHYIILEYVQGGSLRDYLEKTPQMPISQVLEIAIDLSDALGRAHRLNIVHRDIKPANVLLADDGTPRLTDFGIAHIGDTSRMTQEGSIIGTMAYMPPEALAGKAVDVRGDIWSFGVMLYEMVTGRHPFVGESTAEMLFSIVKNDPPDILSLRDYEDFGSWGLPGLIYWMIEKDREKRPASARLVGAMVEHLMAGRELPQLNALANYPGDTEEEQLPPETAAELARTYTTAGFSVEKLNEQLANANLAASMRTTETVVEAQQVIQEERKQARNHTQMIAIGVVLTIVLLGAAGFAFLGGGDTDSAAFAVPRDCDAEPIAEGTFMILVAQPEYIDGDERDVQRFITDDLTEHLEQTIPNSRYRVRNTETIVRDSEIAEQVAELCGAVAILWGNYDSQRVEINIQIGAEDAYPAPFVVPYDEARFIADGRYHLTNEREQTLAVGVIGTMNMGWTSINEGYNLVEALTIAQLISDPQPEVVGSTASARYHQYILNYVNNPALGITFLDQAITTNGGNALLYAARGLGYQRVGDISAASEDADTANRLGADGWVIPEIMLANNAVYFQEDLEAAITLLDDYVTERPESWFPYTYRGSLNYLLQNYDRARPDIEQSLSLNPVSNIPYASGVGLALRDADFMRAQTLIQEAQREFPNPSVLEQILSATFNEEAVSSPLTSFVSAFSNLSLGRWQGVINDANTIIETGLVHPDPYLLRGFAQCNLQDYEAAEASYSEAVNIAPDYTMLYFLRAEVRQRQGLERSLDALADLQIVIESEQSAQFEPFTSLGVDITSQVNCENIFDIDLADFGFETQGTTDE